MSASRCTGSGGRGCPCAWHQWRKRYNREYARRQRARQLDAKNATGTRCQHRQGPGRCNALLEITVGEFGRTIAVCPACERRKRGICRDCPRPVDGQIGKAIRCAVHKHEAQLAQCRASEARHHEERLAKAREYYQANEERRQRKLEYKRAYRKAHPEKVRAYKRREALAQGEHRLAWHRKHNRKKARILRKRQQAMLAYYREHPTRPTPKCRGCDKYLGWVPLPGGHSGRPPVWCDGCAPMGERLRRAARGRSIPALDAPPAVAWAPPLREIERSLGGPRTCVTEGCEIVVTGRKKKCTKCREREQREAEQQLASHRGRGRRTDLERVA